MENKKKLTTKETEKVTSGMKKPVVKLVQCKKCDNKFYVGTYSNSDPPYCRECKNTEVFCYLDEKTYDKTSVECNKCGNTFDIWGFGVPCCPKCNSMSVSKVYLF